MNKLQPKDIARYLPYDLFAISEDRNRADRVLGVYGTGWHSVTMCCRVNNHNTVDYGVSIEGIKPALFPCDNLTTPITVKGKTITPLLELAKIAFPLQNWYVDSYECTDGTEQFKYRKNINSFTLRDKSFDKHDVRNQSALFDWMDEHFIDYRGLIPQSLAVDVTTLKDNPYAT